MPYPNTVSSLPGTWSYIRNRHCIPSVLGDQSGYKAQVGFITDYSNQAAFITSIGGSASTITTAFGSMSRVFRMQHPEFTGLYATAVRSEATGESSGSGFTQMYSKVKVIVDFETPTYPVTGDTAFSTWDIDQSSQYTTQPGRKFKFSTGEPIDQEAGSFAILNTYTLTLFNCPSLNDSAIDLCTASPRNSAIFMGRPIGSLLFGGCKSVINTAVGGVVTYQKSLSFTYRSYDWNSAYRHDGVLSTPTDPAGNPIYPSSDFYTMFS